jgi:hypothetical protein
VKGGVRNHQIAISLEASVELWADRDSVTVRGFGDLPCSITHISASFWLISMLWVYHAQVTGQRIVPAEGFLLGAVRAVHLDLLRVVNGVFVSGEVVRTREYRVARLAG